MRMRCTMLTVALLATLSAFAQLPPGAQLGDVVLCPYVATGSSRDYVRIHPDERRAFADEHFPCYLLGIGSIDPQDPVFADARTSSPNAFRSWIPREYLHERRSLGDGAECRYVVLRYDDPARPPSEWRYFRSLYVYDDGNEMIEVRAPYLPLGIDHRNLIVAFGLGGCEPKE